MVCDRALGDVGGDARIRLAAAEADQAEPRHQNHARRAIEHDLAAADAGIVAREVGLVVCDEILRRLDRVALEVGELARRRRRYDQRPALGADGVIGSYHAGARIACHLLAVDEREDGVAAAELQEQPPPGAFDVAVPQRAGATQDRRDLANRGHPRGQRSGREHPLAPALQPLLGQRDHLDHALVGLVCAGTECEDAVLVEDQALDHGVRVEHLGGCLGEAEPRPMVGHESQSRAVDVARQLLAARLVDQAEHGVGVRVIHERVRHEGVQQHLHRRARRRRIEQIGALHALHVLVAQRLAAAKLAQGLELHRRQPRRVDRGHVAARALDAQHRVRLASQVRHLGLERGVAAAVQHECGIAPQQPRRVDAQRQRLARP